MQLTQKQFDRFRPINNWVLIKPSRGNDEVILNQGQDDEVKLYLDVRFEALKHAPIVGEVVKVPENVFFSLKSPDSLQWKTKMELKPGDEVVYHYLSAAKALGLEKNNYGQTLKDTKYYTIEGKPDEVYILVKYDKIFAAKRGPEKEVVMVNGYILVEPLERKIKESIIHMPEMVKAVNKKSSTYGKVRYLGSRNEAYKNDPTKFDTPELSIGDVVALEDVSDIPLEYDVHASFEGKTVFYRAQRHQLLAIVKDYESVIEEYIPLVAPE